MPAAHGVLADAPLEKLLKVTRRLLPASLRARIRVLLFQWFDLAHTRPSGVRVRLANYTDWVVYNEIFVDSEYDEAISRALDLAPETTPLSVVDLGANAGFFTLRVVDQAHQRRVERERLRITAVEGSRWLVEEFRSRVILENALSKHVRLVHGLIGERAGTATFYEADSHLSNTLFRGSAGSGVQVDYVDLSPLFTSEPVIALLKCDIEGAEQLFIQNYPDLLGKVRVAVFELHTHYCDTRLCQRLLRECGFTRQIALRQKETSTTYCVWR
jgi:FkbM family methyltransferase